MTPNGGGPTLEKMIQQIAKEVIEQHEYEMSKAELKAIVHELLPNIDELISEKVKQHFLAIGQYIVSNCEKEGE